MTLEELLNTLIKKGWKPFWRKYNAVSLWDFNTISFNYYNDIDEERGVANYSIRELVSKESWLWQFVCNNWMIPEDRKCHERVLDLTFWPNWPDVSAQMCSRNYEYWLMSSAICDEKYLEQFLIENIKI